MHVPPLIVIYMETKLCLLYCEYELLLLDSWAVYYALPIKKKKLKKSEIRPNISQWTFQRGTISNRNSAAPELVLWLNGVLQTE